MIYRPMDAISKKILNHLLDKYESSKSFNGENKVSQTFSVAPGGLFKKYMDDAEYDYFIEINECISRLKERHFVSVIQRKNGVVEKIILDMAHLDEIYAALGRASRKAEHMWLEGLWEQVLLEQDEKAGIPPLVSYIAASRERLSKNKSVEYYDGSHEDYRDLLEAVKKVFLNEQEIYIRDFSIAIFADSKRMEQLKAKVQSFLFIYGSYEEKEHVLEECGIVSTPTYVAVKGNGILVLGKQQIDLSALNGDIALSTETIKELAKVKVLGKRVITVENMTSFHDYSNQEDFVIYLGGFHNKVKREMIQFLYSMNQSKSYYHFGDIDAGGFYIFEHLCDKTGVNFKLLNMSIDVLEKYRAYWKRLTPGDEKRIRQLIEKLNFKESLGEAYCDYREVLYFMLDNHCKLEQENLKNHI